MPRLRIFSKVFFRDMAGMSIIGVVIHEQHAFQRYALLYLVHRQYKSGSPPFQTRFSVMFEVKVPVHGRNSADYLIPSLLLLSYLVRDNSCKFVQSAYDQIYNETMFMLLIQSCLGNNDTMFSRWVGAKRPTPCISDEDLNVLPTLIMWISK